MLRKLLPLAPVLFLMSCASLNEDACRTGDWEGIGFRDGTNGRLTSYISEHREACGEYGIAPNSAAWLRGRIEGLKQYCTPDNAYWVGRRGSELAPVCSAAQSSDLRLANFYGMRYHEIDSEIDFLEDQMDELLTRLSEDFSGELTAEQNELQRFFFTEVRSLEQRIRALEFDRLNYNDLP